MNLSAFTGQDKYSSMHVKLDSLHSIVYFPTGNYRLDSRLRRQDLAVLRLSESKFNIQIFNIQYLERRHQVMYDVKQCMYSISRMYNIQISDSCYM